MDDTPNDSGELPDNAIPIIEPSSQEDPSGVVQASVVSQSTPPRAVAMGAFVRRPAIWGLLVLIAAVLVAQVWLLFF